MEDIFRAKIVVEFRIERYDEIQHSLVPPTSSLISQSVTNTFLLHQGMFLKH